MKKLLEKPLVVIVVSFILGFISLNAIGGTALLGLSDTTPEDSGVFMLILILGVASIISYILLTFYIGIVSLKQVIVQKKFTSKSGFLFLWSIILVSFPFYIFSIRPDIEKKSSQETFADSATFKQQLKKEFETPITIQSVAEIPYNDELTLNLFNNGSIVFTMSNGRRIVNPDIYWNCDKELRQKLVYANTLVGKTVKLEVDNNSEVLLLNRVVTAKDKLPIAAHMSIDNQPVDCNSIR